MVRIGAWTGEWIDREVPGILASVERQWGVEHTEVLIGGACSVVVAGTAPDGHGGRRETVTKLFPARADHPDDRAAFDHERMGWRMWEGDPMPSLLGADVRRCVLLQERVRPGTLMEATFGEEVVGQAAEVLSRLHAAQPVAGLPSLDELVARRTAAAFEQLAMTKDRFPRALVERAGVLARRLLASSGRRVPSHGDFYLNNIIDGGEGGWRPIDAQPVLAEAAFDAGVFAYARHRGTRAEQIAAELAERLGLQGDRVRDWATFTAATNVVGRVASGHATPKEVDASLAFVARHPVFHGLDLDGRGADLGAHLGAA